MFSSCRLMIYKGGCSQICTPSYKKKKTATKGWWLVVKLSCTKSCIVFLLAWYRCSAVRQRCRGGHNTPASSLLLDSGLVFRVHDEGAAVNHADFSVCGLEIWEVRKWPNSKDVNEMKKKHTTWTHPGWVASLLEELPHIYFRYESSNETKGSV